MSQLVFQRLSRIQVLVPGPDGWCLMDVGEPEPAPEQCQGDTANPIQPVIGPWGWTPVPTAINPQPTAPEHKRANPFYPKTKDW